LSASFLGFRRKRERRKAGEQKLLILVPRVYRGRRRPTVSFKTAPFGAFLFFFFETVDKTTQFYPKHAVSFKRKWRQKRVKIQIILNL
jgi:hypothetical protein